MAQRRNHTAINDTDGMPRVDGGKIAEHVTDEILRREAKRSRTHLLEEAAARGLAPSAPPRHQSLQAFSNGTARSRHHPLVRNRRMIRGHAREIAGCV